MADTEASRSRRLPRFPHITRDSFLLAVGTCLTINELVIRSGQERPYVLVLLAGMMGLPVFLHADEKRRDNRDGSG